MRTACCALAAALVLAGGCGRDEPEHAHKEGHGHTAAHGGCLNAIGSCETGHAEIRVEGDVLKLWFVGGGNETDKAVRVPDKEIVLSVTVGGEKEPRSLTLRACPNPLAEEKEGDCSCFQGRADWLKGAAEFEAAGTVTFKGRKESLEVHYPHGHDPDHEAGGGEGEHHEH